MGLVQSHPSWKPFMRTMFTVLVCIACFAKSVPANGAGPSVEAVSPGIGQRGTDFNVRLLGAGLTESAEVVLYRSGLTRAGLRSLSENELIVALKAEPDCPLGAHPFRIRTSAGLSELKIIRVTPFPVVVAIEPNQSPSQAMPVSNNVTIAGVLESGDIDCFEVTLRKGERLAAEVEAVRLGGQLIDTVLRVFGPDGKQLAKADDTPLTGQDPCLTLIVPDDGKYVVQIQEAALEGDENSRYALHLGKFPRPGFAFPPGGPAGQTLKLAFQGDAVGVIEQQVVLPSLDEPDFELYAEQDGLAAPTAIPFRVSPFGNVLESEPNDELSNVSETPVELPIAFNGRLEQSGDVDRFRFRMAAGQEFQFESFAERLGSRADTVISIIDMTGRLLVRNDDEGSHDSRLVFQARQTGEYQLLVTDKRGSGDANFVYRVEATSLKSQWTAFLPRRNRESQERQAISVPRGNRVMTFLGVRRQGVDGPARVQISDLPAGVNVSEATIPPDQFLTPVVFEAAADAPFTGTLARIRVAGESEVANVSGGFQQVVDLVHGSADTLYQAAKVDRLAMAVVEPVSIQIRLEEPKSALSQDGTIGLVVHVVRAEDFNGPVDVTFPFLPPAVDGPAKLTIHEAETRGVYFIHAFPDAVPRTWPICAEGRPGLATTRDATTGTAAGVPSYRGGRRGRTVSDAIVASKLVNLTIAPSPVTGSMGRVATEQGAKLKLTCSLTRNQELPGTLIATLEGLPNRVFVKPVTINALDRQVEFAMELDNTAPLGTFNSLVCRLTGTIDGQEISYCVGRGGVLRIERPGALVLDSSGRPLTPLEILRQSSAKPLTESPKPATPSGSK